MTQQRQSKPSQEEQNSFDAIVGIVGGAAITTNIHPEAKQFLWCNLTQRAKAEDRN
jgi:hypothetical protein